MKKKITLTVTALALVICVAAGATLAWLVDKTDDVTNTFTYGNIDITLTETWNTDTDGDETNDAWVAKMIPGNTISKDPEVTVEGGSEACWLFVKVTESETLKDFITYTVNSDWKELEDGVYYREVEASDSDQSFNVLDGDQVTVSSTVTKTMMDGLEAGTTTAPTLTFKAYAIQKSNFSDAATAWTEVSK